MALPRLDNDAEFNQQTDPRPSIIVGDDKWVINEEAGAKIISQPGQHSILEARFVPAYNPPERFQHFQQTVLDRRRELSLAAKALEARQSVEFYGSVGAGKRTLLHALASRVPAATFPDGVIHLLAHHQTLADLRQALFDTFYKSDPPLKPSLAAIKRHLETKQALIVLDDIKLSQPDLEALLETAPGCAFLMASTTHHPWTSWQTIAVLELLPDDALGLVERAMQRPITTEESPVAQTICRLLDNHALNILQVISFARTQNLSLAKIAAELQAASSGQEIADLLLSALTESEQKIMGILAAAGGAPLTLDHLADLTGLSNLKPILQSLEARYLIANDYGRFGLLGALQEALARTLDLDPLIEQSLTHFTIWAERNQFNINNLLAETDVLPQILSRAVEAERWRQVLHLTRSIENALFGSRQWGLWEQALKWILQAARQLGDQGAEAWALHQLGTRSLCLGEDDRARQDLEQALQMRLALDDQVGIAITKHNLGPRWTSVEALEAHKSPAPYEPPVPQDYSPQPAIALPGSDNPEASEDRPATKRFVPAIPVIAALVILVLGIMALFLAFRQIVAPFIQTPSQASISNSVSDSETAVISLSSRRLNFSSQPTGQQSAPQSVTVTNTGPDILMLSNITLAGEHPDAFLLDDTDCTGKALNQAKSCLISVSFAPQATGPQYARLIIGDTGQTVQLNGAEVYRINSQPAQQDFGAQLINTSTIPQPITLVNEGLTDLTIETVELASSQKDAFAITVDQCSRTSLGPGNRCQIYLIFIPKQAGNYTANLIINAGRASVSYPVPLRGSGVLPTPTPTPTFTPSPTPTITPTPTPTPTGTRVFGGVVAPTSLAFADQLVNTDSPIKEIALTNNGPGSLTVNKVAVYGPNAADFIRTADTCAGTTLNPGTRCTITFIFRPTVVGNRQAKVIIKHNAANSPHKITLQGTGLRAIGQLCSLPARLEFGQQQINIASPERTLTLKNCGPAPLTIQTISLSGAHPTEFTNSGSYFKCQGVTIPADGLCIIGYRFVPRASGARSAILTIIHNGSSSSQETHQVTFEGIGISTTP